MVTVVVGVGVPGVHGPKKVAKLRVNYGGGGGALEI